MIHRFLPATRRFAVIAFLAVGLVASVLWPSTSRAADGRQATVEVGIFVGSIYDVDFYNEKFETIFWVWYLFDDPDYDPLTSVEVVNARSHEIVESYEVEREDGRRYVAVKMKAVINQPWDLGDFPFDAQTLRIALESVGKQSDALKLVADMANSVVGPEIHLHEWAIGGLAGETREFTYNTTFGEEAAEHGTFSRVEFTIDISRGSAKLFFEAYIGYFIAVIMCAAIWMSVGYHMPEYRIGLILAGVFCAIGNKNVIESNYPSTAHFGLGDAIEISTFLLISACLVVSVACEGLHFKDNRPAARRLGMVVFPVLIGVYLVYVSFYLVEAVAG